MAFGSGKKPANQGSSGTPHVKPAKTSPAYPTSGKATTPRTADGDSKRRGVHTPGVRGTKKP